MSEQKLKPIDKSKKNNRRCYNCEYYPNKANYFEPSPCEKKSQLVNWKCCELFTWSSKKAYKEETMSEPKPKWISVKDELPSPIHPSDPDYRPYLIIADGDIYLADYSYGKYFETCYSFYVDGEEMTGVTHWMKLPEPPKGEHEGER